MVSGRDTGGGANQSKVNRTIHSVLTAPEPCDADDECHRPVVDPFELKAALVVGLGRENPGDRGCSSTVM